MNTVAEQAYSDALTLIAVGEEWSTARDTISDSFSTRLTIRQVETIMRGALRDALKQGVEREDIDPSWFEIG